LFLERGGAGTECTSLFYNTNPLPAFPKYKVLLFCILRKQAKCPATHTLNVYTSLEPQLQEAMPLLLQTSGNLDLCSTHRQTGVDCSWRQYIETSVLTGTKVNVPYSTNTKGPIYRSKTFPMKDTHTTRRRDISIRCIGNNVEKQETRKS
jgi:hypothetical protein